MTIREDADKSEDEIRDLAYSLREKIKHHKHVYGRNLYEKVFKTIYEEE